MILIKDYADLTDTLLHIKKQVIDSLDFANVWLPSIDDPAELFMYLKDRTTYISDPPGIELIMTMQTMISGSRTGIPGGGDCDDFTIAALASLYCIGFTDLRVVLAGRRRTLPVHIYCDVNDGTGWKAFDLTEDHYGQFRPYPYYQNLTFSLL